MGLTTTITPTVQFPQSNWTSANKELGRVDAIAYDPVNVMWYVGGNFSGSGQVQTLGDTGTAPTVVRNLGTAVSNSGSTTIALTTNHSVAAGNHVILVVGNSGAQVVTSVAGGSLTWQVDKTKNQASADGASICSAYAPAGLVTSTTITATLTASAVHREITAYEVTGLKTSGWLDATGSNGGGTVPDASALSSVAAKTVAFVAYRWGQVVSNSDWTAPAALTQGLSVASALQTLMTATASFSTAQSADSTLISTTAPNNDYGAVWVTYAAAPVTTQTRNFICAINATTLELDTSWDPNANGRVYDIKVSPDGSQVYVAGAFTTIGGQTRHSLASLQPANGSNTGTATSKISDIGFNAVVRDIHLSGDAKTMWVGGDFTNGGGGTRLAKMDISGSSQVMNTNWNPSLNNLVHDVYVDEVTNTCYAAGDFTDTGHSFLAAMNSGSAGGFQTGLYAPTDRCLCLDGVQGVSVWVGEVHDRDTKIDVNTKKMVAWRGCDGNVQANLIYQDEILSGHHGGCVANAIDQSQGNLSGGVCPNGGVRSFKVWAMSQSSLAIDSAFLPNLSTSAGVLGVWAFATDGTNVALGGDFTGAGGTNNAYRFAIFAGSGGGPPPPPPTCPPGTHGIYPNCIPDTPPPTPPTVTITSPSDGTTVFGSSVVVTADAEVTASGASIVSTSLTVNGTVIAMTPGTPPVNDTQAPSIPQNLHSNGASATSVSLSWDASTDNVGVAGYNIYRYPGP